MPTSKHGLVSEQDVCWNSIQKSMDGLPQVSHQEAWHIFRHLTMTHRTGLSNFLEAVRTKLEQWEHKKKEEPFLPAKPQPGTCWVEAMNEVRRFGNNAPELLACVGLADTIAMCFTAASIGDTDFLQKLRVIARDN